MSIISALRTYLSSYTELKDDAPLWVDYLGPNPTEYSIQPIAGPRVVERYLNGGSVREFPFVFQSMESTADDLERLENIGFFEAFADWLDLQTVNNVYPVLGAKQIPLSIEAIGIAYLYEQGISDTGVYQIQCKLTYEQQP
jgi:hypothetical protein